MFLKTIVLKLKKYIAFIFSPKYYFGLERDLAFLQNEFGHLQKINNQLKQMHIKSKKNEKIVVVFLVQEVSLFSVFDSVINKLLNNGKFKCHVIIAPQYFCKKWNEDSYSELKKYFLKKGIISIDGVVKISSENEIEEVLDLQTLNPHYVFYTCPYMEDYHIFHRCAYVNNFAHVCYIPYGFLLAEQPETQYHQEVHNLAYRVYCETDFHNKNYAARCDKEAKVITTGYTKFDLLDNIKVANEIKNIKSNFNKIVIIAPHWSVGNLSSVTCYGTFDKYYEHIEKLLITFPNVYFVFKPHPSLKNALLRANVLQLKEYEKLLSVWSKRSNFCFYDGADYFEYFAISDALITDSVSFLAEYVLFDKPLLLLCRQDSSPYNKIGNLLVNSFYKAYCSEDIYDFMKNIILADHDHLYDKRNALIEMIRGSSQQAADLIENDLLNVN